jgi:hypothetical protein
MKKEKKTKRITILFTDEEYKTIKRKADQNRIPMSIIARQYVLKGIGTIQTELFR